MSLIQFFLANDPPCAGLRTGTENDFKNRYQNRYFFTIFGTSKKSESLFFKIKKDKNRTGTGTEISFYPKNRNRTETETVKFYIGFCSHFLTFFFNFPSLLGLLISPNTPCPIIYPWLATRHSLQRCFLSLLIVISSRIEFI